MDFLDQLIGHAPGENFDINVTFPDPYTNNTDLSGKDAVFNITINYIEEKITPEFDDDLSLRICRIMRAQRHIVRASMTICTSRTCITHCSSM